MRQPTTSLDEIASLDIPTIRPVDVAKALGIDQYAINVSFKSGTPMFPGFMSGNRVHILRVPFLKAVGYETKGKRDA